MRRSNKSSLLIGLLFLVLMFSTFGESIKFESNIESLYEDSCEIENLKSSGFWNLTGSPIYIDDTNPNFNWSKTAADNDWCSGSGTFSDPYVIENVTIDGQTTDNCIEIRNSFVYFVLRNITIFNGQIGISLINIYNVNKNYIN